MSESIQPFSASINLSVGRTQIDEFGGPGSGFFGHKGRLGIPGGAAPLDDNAKENDKPFFSRERKAIGITGASSARIHTAVERSYTDQPLTPSDKEILQILWPGIHGDPETEFVSLQKAIMKEEGKSGGIKIPEKEEYPKPPKSDSGYSEINQRVGSAILKLFQCQANYHCQTGYY
ncbi:unnamed protein product [marine sediment metagenome]|uniref:Uncharacterized protein n=1 Tax=marine sediment metagenome TaxID=412755 RepID=X1GX52_9ZZZZ